MLIIKFYAVLLSYYKLIVFVYLLKQLIISSQLIIVLDCSSRLRKQLTEFHSSKDEVSKSPFYWKTGILPTLLLTKVNQSGWLSTLMDLYR